MSARVNDSTQKHKFDQKVSASIENPSDYVYENHNLILWLCLWKLWTSFWPFWMVNWSFLTILKSVLKKLVAEKIWYNIVIIDIQKDLNLTKMPFQSAATNKEKIE